MSEFNAKSLYDFFLEKREKDWFCKKDMGALLLHISGKNESPYVILLQPENEFCESSDFESLLAYSEETGDVTIGCDFQADFETNYAEIENRDALNKTLKAFGKLFGYDEIRWFPGNQEVWVGRRDCLSPEGAVISPEESVLKELISIPEIKTLELINTIIIHTDDLDAALFVNPADIKDQSTWRETLEVPFFFSNEKTRFLDDGDQRAFFYWLKMAAYIENELPKNTEINTAADFKVLVVQHDDLLDESWRDVGLINSDLSVQEFIEKLYGDK